MLCKEFFSSASQPESAHLCDDDEKRIYNQVKRNQFCIPNALTIATGDGDDALFRFHQGGLLPFLT